MNLATIRVVFQPFLTSLVKTKNVLFSPQFLLYTNTTLTVGLSVTGDLLQQNYQAATSKRKQGWDVQRTKNIAFTGLLIGPFVHYWYILLDGRFRGRGFRTLVKKVVLDQIICSPVYLGMFVLSLGVLEGRKWSQIKEDVMGKGPVLYAAEWVVWPPAQAVNFYLLPTKYRVLYDNSISLMFDFFWSYVWYEMDKDQEEKEAETQDVPDDKPNDYFQSTISNNQNKVVLQETALKQVKESSL